VRAIEETIADILERRETVEACPQEVASPKL
jgi:hypothetical protein